MQNDIFKDELLKEVKEINSVTDNLSYNKGLFKAMPANKWIDEAKKRAIPGMLFGELWHEGELCILFADTNQGKSILSVQIGDSISKGEQIPGFPIEIKKQTVLYFDFELSDKQFENRYSIKYESHYSFDNAFIRVEINPDANIPDQQSFEEYLNQSLERVIKESGAKIIIIDNLTYLRNETERAKDALPLMKHLKALKSTYNLSILALAHTPKRDLSKPITRNDLQGSKMLINFCDSSFAIGESTSDQSTKYIKQIKSRNTEIKYDAENVIICQIAKPRNFLQFEFIGFGSERTHLKQFTKEDRSTLIEKAKELNQQNRSQREIATELGISVGSVNKYLKL